MHIWLRDEDGKPVRFSKAEMFLGGDAWFGPVNPKIVPLGTKDDLLELSYERDVLPWQKEVVGEGGELILRLYIEADGYAAIESRRMGFTEYSSPREASHLIVEFPTGPAVDAPRGKTTEIKVTLRKSRDRYLHFIDDQILPVPGVAVKAYLFFSDDNRCAVSTNERFLAEGVSDKEGLIRVPDGDFEYWLTFEKSPYQLRDFEQFKPPFGWRPMEYLAYLQGREIVVGLHKLKSQPLQMLVTRGGVPAANETLWGWFIGDTCWPGDNELAKTDENGQIFIEEFYPEKWHLLYFSDVEWQSRFYNERLWEADPNQLSLSQTITVDLPGDGGQ